MINVQELVIFLLVFATITGIGFIAARWRSGNLNRLQEWGLAGRRFGTLITWLLLGGDIYTAHAFIAAPGLVFSKGAIGFYVIPYHIFACVLAFVFLPRFWTVARHRGYVTVADFVRERFDSSTLALLVALTGILAMMSYIALQIYGIEVVLAQTGIPVELSLFLAFGVLAAYTFVSGLRAPALIAIIKDVLIWLVELVAIIYIPSKLGGFDGIFAAVHQKAIQHPNSFHDMLSPSDASAYTTLAIGSALALYLFPHTLTGVLSANSRKVIQRNAVLLGAYIILFGLICLLGYVAIAAQINVSPMYGANSIVPALFAKMFPPWFVGVAFAAIAIGAFVPAAIMSIAAANLFTRNIYRQYIHPSCSEREESLAARIASLVVKIGALAFILLLPNTLAINFQLVSVIWIVQTLPAVFIGLYTNWFHRHALIIGWAVGMISGTWMVVSQHFQSSVYPLTFGGVSLPVNAAVPALVLNLFLCLTLTVAFKGLGIAAGEDATHAADYEARPVKGISRRSGQTMKQPVVRPQQPSHESRTGSSIPMPRQPVR